MIIYNTVCKKLQEVAFTMARIQTKQTVQPDATGPEEEAPLCKFEAHPHGAKYSSTKRVILVKVIRTPHPLTPF